LRQTHREPTRHFRFDEDGIIEALGAAKIVVTNFHTFLPRERGDASRLTKRILTRGHEEASPFRETPDQVVRRFCRDLGGKHHIIVLNDEAHHCYRRRPSEDAAEKLSGGEKREAERREEEARVWISGLEAVKRKLGLRAVYDLSATPFFLKGSGYDEGTLFPWVVSDFSLIDAIESGLVKVPRVPVDDDSARPDMPTFRNIWASIKDELPKRASKGYAPGAGPVLPARSPSRSSTTTATKCRRCTTCEGSAAPFLDCQSIVHQ
jgi:type III restriction enzyme